MPVGELSSGGGTHVELKSSMHGVVGIELGGSDESVGSCDGNIEG
mgnify:CR=1 FL=1